MSKTLAPSHSARTNRHELPNNILASFWCKRASAG